MGSVSMYVVEKISEANAYRRMQFFNAKGDKVRTESLACFAELLGWGVTPTVGNPSSSLSFWKGMSQGEGYAECAAGAIKVDRRTT